MDETLDLRGLKCPLPAMLARKALARLAEGTQLIVLADDPMAVVDIPHMCHHEGHAVDGVTTRDGHSEFLLRAKSGSAG
ncbi:MAG TPA: sulfurtransferase TusA family protein [Rhizomicrobium sp.]|jgi:tRNA 2-thiouridine synthesizing protein A